ncbi:hypothetical protein [Nakamurella leprariae]|uniref:SdpI family protein n=1 Tax=Nakamurella leprariae TaxID=2803911 RepID=A0A938YFJ2_9ACTN|nr:hypothetical protein [Nakamurella leprariae]MBM9468949.1 hypothetical protein [Nakamurella leprariae]
MPTAPLALTLICAALFLVLAAASGLTAWASFVGRLHRTGKLGVHSPAAVQTDRHFALANRVAAPVVSGAAGVAAVFALIMLFAPINTLATVVLAVVGLVGTAALLVVGGSLGERAAQALPRPARKPTGGGCDGCACGTAEQSGCAVAALKSGSHHQH